MLIILPSFLPFSRRRKIESRRVVQTGESGPPPLLLSLFLLSFLLSLSFTVRGASLPASNRLSFGSSGWRGYKASGAERYVIRYSFFSVFFFFFYLRPRNKFGNKLREAQLACLSPWRAATFEEAKEEEKGGMSRWPRFNRHVRGRRFSSPRLMAEPAQMTALMEE